MRIAWSLLTREYVAAQDVGYDDCRDFQIACPSCREAVFKSGEQGSAHRQFFSHYRASKSDVPDCELRVARLSPEDIALANAQGRGQTLERFHSGFRGAYLSAAIAAEGRPDAVGLVDRMVARKAWRQFALRARDDIRAGRWGEGVWDYIAERYYSDHSPYWRSRQQAFAADYLAHLVAPTSAKAFLWAFALATYVQWNSVEAMLSGDAPVRHSDGYSPQGKRELMLRQVEIYETMCVGSDRKMRELDRGLLRTTGVQGASSQAQGIGRAISNTMRALLVRTDWLGMLR